MKELENAKRYLGMAQSLNESGFVEQAFFVLGCALNKVIEHLEGGEEL